MKNDCRYFDVCSAPLCPKDEESLTFGCWYPDEETCKRQPLPAWIKTQKKISKKTDNTDLYFTFKMLNHNCITSHIGIDPNKCREEEELKWLKNHKIKKQLSAKEAQKRIERIKKNNLTVGD